METIYIIIAVIVARLIIEISSPANVSANAKPRRPRKLKRGKAYQVYGDRFIDVTAYYQMLNRVIPNISFIRDIDSTKVFGKIRDEAYGKVQGLYQRCYYDWDDKKHEFNYTLFELDNNIMIKIGDGWLEIFHDGQAVELVTRMRDEFVEMKMPAKEKDYEINIISISNDYLDLRTLAIQPMQLDLDLFYNDDFKKVDAIIRERLTKEKDKGIVLLHGLPGTGKTTYLRHLVGSVDKKVMFVSPSVATNLMNPEFMNLLLDHPNSLLVIEDAENIIMDRRYSSQSSVSNLLNISDGLLSDCLNVQIICTFNSDLNMVDSALLRKGRLIAKYEFGKLSVAKAQALSNHLGMEQVITQPMTLAEITNPGETNYEPAKVNVIGFRRTHELIEN